jgi:hypothetical protein
LHKTNVPGVSKFDFAVWRASGSPTVTYAGWAALCQIIASKDLVNLGSLFAVADPMKTPSTMPVFGGKDQEMFPALKRR